VGRSGGGARSVVESESVDESSGAGRDGVCCVEFEDGGHAGFHFEFGGGSCAEVAEESGECGVMSDEDELLAGVGVGALSEEFEGGVDGGVDEEAGVGVGLDGESGGDGCGGAGCAESRRGDDGGLFEELGEFLGEEVGLAFTAWFEVSIGVGAGG